MTCKWQMLRDSYNAVAFEEIQRGKTMDDAAFWKSVVHKYSHRERYAERARNKSK